MAGHSGFEPRGDFYPDVVKGLRVPFLRGTQISYCTWTHPFSAGKAAGSASLAELGLVPDSLLSIP